MSTPEPAGRSRPLRVAGLALLGIAVGALLVGLVSLGGDDGNGGNSGDGGDGGNATSSASDTPQASPGTGDTAPPVATTTEQPPAPPPPSATTAAPPVQPPPVQPEPRAPLRVYNNSTIPNLAADAAADFRSAGWVVDEVGNYSAGIIPTSTVYYRPGSGEEAAAQALGNRFNLRVEPRFPGLGSASPGIIVIVTQDYGSK